MLLKPTVVKLFVLVSAPLLTVAHLFYSWAVSLYLYRLAGGVAYSGGWTKFGGAAFAWTIPLQLPGTLLLSCEKPVVSSVITAKALVLAASIGVGYSVASLATSLILKDGLARPYADWRVLTIILGMIWIPVPETLAFVYYYTVKY